MQSQSICNPTVRVVTAVLLETCTLQAIARGVEVDVVDKLHNTPLMIASRLGKHKMVLELLKRRADPNRYNLYDESALFFAARHNQLDVIKVCTEELSSCLACEYTCTGVFQFPLTM